MANEALQAQTVLVQLKTVAAANVPVPGDGPVTFGDSDGTLTVKLTDGSTIAFGATGITRTTAAGVTTVLGQPYMTDALVEGAAGDTVQTVATIVALEDTAILDDAVGQDAVGKVISIEGAGDGADHISTITVVSEDGLTVTLADACVDGATDAVTFVGTSDVAALDAADTLQGATGTLLIPPGVYMIDDDLTLTAGTVKVMRGASFVVLEGFTLAFSGFVDAAPDQVALLMDADSNGAVTRNVPNVLSGTATPENAVVGIIGDLYTDIAGGAGTTLYAKESGDNTNTGWSTTA